MNQLKKLRHLHLPGLVPYPRASAIQDYLVRAHLDHRAAKSTSPSPGPVVLTFQTPPTYTYGRREIGSISDSQIAHLRAGGEAEVYEALRGGQTTFHGPGQLTVFLIVSLQDHGLNTRSHVRLLENATIGTCKSYHLTTRVTENPGVWIDSQPDERKIASVGVHLRRYIASHGIGLNVSVDLSWFDRIVACGLIGKRATNIEQELRLRYGDTEPYRRSNQHRQDIPTSMPEEVGSLPSPFPMPMTIAHVADIFVRNVAMRLSGLSSQAVDAVTEQDLLPERAQPSSIK